MASSTSPQESKAYAYTWLIGLTRGYGPAELTWICKQVRLETGGWSNGLIQGRNPFGLGCAQVRPTSQVGCIENQDVGIGVYSSIWKAVQDRFAWDEYWGIQPGATYAADVSAKYHTSSDYAASVASVDSRYMRQGMVKATAILLLGTIVANRLL